jgi:hypothetical protein
VSDASPRLNFFLRSLSRGANVIKTFCVCDLRMFVIIKCLSLATLSRKVLQSQVGSWHYPQTLDLPGEVCQVQTLLLNMNTRQLARVLDPGKPFLPFLIGATISGRHLALPKTIRLGWKGLPGSTTLAYYEHS